MTIEITPNSDRPELYDLTRWRGGAGNTITVTLDEIAEIASRAIDTLTEAARKANQ